MSARNRTRQPLTPGMTPCTQIGRRRRERSAPKAPERRGEHREARATRAAAATAAALSKAACGLHAPAQAWRARAAHDELCMRMRGALANGGAPMHLHLGYT